MTRPGDTPEHRVQQLVAAARRLADPDDSMGRRAREILPRVCGLSPEAVDLGLSCSLEVNPSETELRMLCASVPRASRAHVLLSANVFVAAHRAIALALAAAGAVEVRASRREPEMARLLHEASGGLFRMVDELAPLPGEHVWAYGTDETLEALRGDLPSGVILHAHGSGMGVAVVEPAEDEQDELGRVRDVARSLALDVVLFDQRGCLSPRLVLVRAKRDIARELAVALGRELAEYEQRIPRGAMLPEELADASRYRDTMLYAAEIFPAGRGWVGFDSEHERVYLPPVGRNVHVLRVESPTAVLEPLASSVVGLGVAGSVGLWDRLRQAFPHARISPIGKMQTPAFDGPVDRRPERTGEAL